jgi:hypothetical protein
MPHPQRLVKRNYLQKSRKKFLTNFAFALKMAHREDLALKKFAPFP